jgi:hypothetical protein
MAFNGSGTYNLPAGNPVVTGTTISSSTTNTTNSDIATALTNCITRDGQSTPSANLPMNAKKLTGLAAGTSAGDSVRYEQIQYIDGVASAGTSGQALLSQGAGSPPVFSTIITGGLVGIQVFTSSGTFTVPAGVTKVKLTVTGGGGGGDTSISSAMGGAGATAIKYLSVTPSSTIAITVGAGGSFTNQGGTSSAVYGATTVSATGGVGGNTQSGATATGGDINIIGSCGTANFSDTLGGASFWGGSTARYVGEGAYGTGGYPQSGANGAGKAGIVVVEF